MSSPGLVLFMASLFSKQSIQVQANPPHCPLSLRSHLVLGPQSQATLSLTAGTEPTQLETSATECQELGVTAARFTVAQSQKQAGRPLTTEQAHEL